MKTMLKAALKFVRVRILVTCYAVTFVGSAASGTITIKTILSFFLLIGWYVHAASANDYADRYIDQINLKNSDDRPLLTGDVSQKQLWIIHIIGGLSALALSVLYGKWAVIVMLVMLITNYLYSFKPTRISDRGIIGLFVLAIAYVCFPFSLGYWSIKTPDSYPWLLMLGLYLGFMGRLMLKDFRDVKGDKKYGKMTYVLRHGVKTTCLTSAVFWFAGLVILALALKPSVGTLIVLIFGFAQVCLLLKLLSSFKKIKDQMIIVSLIAKAANIIIITILAFILCQKQPSLSRMELDLLPTVIGFVLLLLNSANYRQAVILMQTRW